MCGKTRRRAKDYAESFFDPRSKPYGRLRGKVKKNESVSTGMRDPL